IDKDYGRPRRAAIASVELPSRARVTDLPPAKLVAAIGAADGVAPGRLSSAARAQRRRRGHPWQAQLSHYCGDVAPSNCLSAAGSSRRELTPSFVNTLCRWYSTVRGLMKS